MTETATRTAPVDDSALRDLMGYAVKRAALATEREAMAALREHGLSVVQFSALLLIANNRDITARELAQALDVQPPNLVRVLDALQEAGLVARHPSESDRRALALRATGLGHARAEAARKAVARREEARMAGLARLDRQSARIVLKQLERGP